MNENKKVLLHACCGICSAHPIEQLREMDYEPIVYFYNPNIQPEDEYLKRLEAQKTLCESFNCELIIGDYDLKIFDIVSFGLEDEPEKGKRCEKCFKLRLTESAKKAKKLGINEFTTSIVISPHKNFNLISKLGKEIAKKYDINYLDIDFKKQDGVEKSNRIAKKLGLYRQHYCGCIFSKNKENKHGL